MFNVKDLQLLSTCITAEAYESMRMV